MVRTVVRRVVLFAALAAALPSQQQAQSLALRRLQHALQALDDPVRHGEGVRELARLGAAALPAIRDRLTDAHTGDGHRVLLLRSLAAMGKEALPLLPQCEALLASVDGGTLRAALQAIERVGPYADAGTRARLQLRLLELSNQRLTAFDVAVTQWRLQWGAAVSSATIRAACRDSNEAMLAAMRAIAAGCVSIAADERQPLLRQLRPMLAEWMARPAERVSPSMRNADCAAAIAAAMRHLGAVETPAMLHAFLWHADEAERLRAVMLLADAPNLSSDRQRDIAACLGDDEMSVALAAAGALGRLGAAAMPSLGALLLPLHNDPDGLVGKACGAAVARIFDGSRPDDADAAALLDDLQRLCCGGEVTTGVHWHGTGAAGSWARMLQAVVGVPAAQTALLQAARDCGLDGKEVVDAALAALMVPHQQVWQAALGLLAAQGRKAAAAATGAESPLLLFLSRRAPHASPRDVHECLAWILAGPDASVDELRRALGDDDARVALRAAVELATRGVAMTVPLAAALDQLARRERKPGWAGGLGSTEAYLWQRARAIAALQLAMQGRPQLLVGNPTQALLADLVADVLVVDKDELPQELQRLQRDGLGADARAMERDGRDKLLPARSIGAPR